MNSVFQSFVEYRDVLFFFLSFFGFAFVWRYRELKPYIKASLIEDFKTESFSDLSFDKDGNLMTFESRQYILELTVHPMKQRCELVKLISSSGRLCPVGEWLYREDIERTQSLETQIVLEPSDIDNQPRTFKFQFLPDKEQPNEVSFKMQLNRILFGSVRVYVDYVGPHPQKKQEFDKNGKPIPFQVKAEQITDTRLINSLKK